jgi:hypothetical protein
VFFYNVEHGCSGRTGITACLSLSNNRGV